MTVNVLLTREIVVQEPTHPRMMDDPSLVITIWKNKTLNMVFARGKVAQCSPILLDLRISTWMEDNQERLYRAFFENPVLGSLSVGCNFTENLCL